MSFGLLNFVVTLEAHTLHDSSNTTMLVTRLCAQPFCSIRPKEKLVFFNFFFFFFLSCGNSCLLFFAWIAKFTRNVFNVFFFSHCEKVLKQELSGFRLLFFPISCSCQDHWRACEADRSSPSAKRMRVESPPPPGGATAPDPSHVICSDVQRSPDETWRDSLPLAFLLTKVKGVRREFNRCLAVHIKGTRQALLLLTSRQKCTDVLGDTVFRVKHF